MCTIQLNRHLMRSVGFLCYIYKKKKTQIKALTNDGHERVEVADIEAFPCHVNEELDDASSVLFLHRLYYEKTKAMFIMQGQNIITENKEYALLPNNKTAPQRTTLPWG